MEDKISEPQKENNQAERYPVSVKADYPEQSSRVLALATLLLFIPKMIMVIPHTIVLYVLSVVSFLLAVLAQIAVLFTGRYPRGMFDMVLGVHRWNLRVNTYFLGLTDKYPPFRLRE